MKVTLPYPGSKEAVAKGCKCPVLDNEHGKGYMGLGFDGIFVIKDTCPLHASDYLHNLNINEENEYGKEK